MKKQSGFTSVEMAYVLFVLVVFAGIGGWVWNIVKIVGSDFLWTGMLVARVIGVFVAPLGAVLGFL
jgi:hypothetical protein